MPRWAEAGHRRGDQVASDFMWAHHLDLLPAWLLAHSHAVAGLSTLHGLLVNAGQSDDPQQSRGMVLAAHPSTTVSAVTSEIPDGLQILGV